MTRETYEKASEIFCKINDLESIIEKVEKEEDYLDRPVLNWSFDYEDDKEAFKKNALSFLRARLSTYKTQVSKL